MTVFKSTIFAVTIFILTIPAFGQSLALFDTKLYAEKVTLCDLLNKYVNKRLDFRFSSYDTSFFSISSFDNNSSIFGYWSYSIRNDSLTELGFSSVEFPITAEWFGKLSKLADTAINVFTTKYGKPDRDTVVKKNFFQKGKLNIGDIREAMWVIDGQKLKVDFRATGEKEHFYYLLRIQRFKDYYLNMKLPSWWDGY